MIVYIYAEENKDFIETNKTLELWPKEVSYLPCEKLHTLAEMDVSHQAP